MRGPLAPSCHDRTGKPTARSAVIACPWTPSNPVTCALLDLRTLALADRYALIRDARLDELEEFPALCTSCPCRADSPRSR